MSTPGAPLPDHYQTLGVPPNAEVATIKRHYRTLVRRHHPDIAVDKVGATRHMVMILEAWRVLSDPLERERYDRECRARATRNASRPATPRTAASRASGSASISQGGANANGSSSASRQSKPPAAAKSRSSTPSWSSTPLRTQTSSQRSYCLDKTLDKTVEAARRSFVQGSVPEAIAISKWVLTVDPENAAAAALLGDIFAHEGQRDMALLMYGRAVLYQPANPVYRWKMETLKRASAPTSAPPGHGQGAKAGANGADASDPRQTVFITINSHLSGKSLRRLFSAGGSGTVLLRFALAGTVIGALLGPLWSLIGDAFS